MLEEKPLIKALVLLILLLVICFFLVKLETRSRGVDFKEITAVSLQGDVYLNPQAPPYILTDLEVLASKVYTKNKQLYYTIQCESSWIENNVNKNDPNGGSFGLAQFQIPTFKQFCINKYHLSDSLDDIMNPQIQIECAEKMFNEGLGHHWTCYRKLYQ